MYGEDTTHVPEWVKALSQDERRERGYVKYVSQQDGNPHRDTERWFALIAVLIGVSMAVYSAFGGGAGIGWLGLIILVVGIVMWVRADRHSEWYSTELVMTNEQIAKLAVSEEQAVRNACQIAAALSELNHQIAMPTGFGLSKWEPVYPLQRPGEDNRATFWATVHYYGSEATSQAETQITIGSTYDVHEPEAVIALAQPKLYGAIKGGIDNLREQLQIVA